MTYNIIPIDINIYFNSLLNIDKLFIMSRLNHYRYHGPILMQNANAALARQFLARAQERNLIYNRVLTKNLATRDAERFGF